MRRDTLLGAACLALAGLLLAPAARAQSAPDGKAAAESLFEAGKLSLERGEIGDACRQFEASLRLDPGVGTLLYLADCYEAAGRTASAWATFKEASSLAREGGQAERAELARARADALQPRLSTVKLVCRTCDVAGLRAERNGTLVPPSSFGLALPVDPGTHVIHVTRPGYAPFRTSVSVAPGGASATIAIPELTPLMPRIAADARSTRLDGPRDAHQRRGPRGGAQRTAAIVMGAAGLAALAGGVVLGMRARQLNERSLDECRPKDAALCSERGVALRTDAFASARVSTALVAGGAGLFTAAGVLWLTKPSRPRPRFGIGVALGGAALVVEQRTP